LWTCLRFQPDTVSWNWTSPYEIVYFLFTCCWFLHKSCDHQTVVSITACSPESLDSWLVHMLKFYTIKYHIVLYFLVFILINTNFCVELLHIRTIYWFVAYFGVVVLFLVLFKLFFLLLSFAICFVVWFSVF
jgi:hypothetical protein